MDESPEDQSGSSEMSLDMSEAAPSEDQPTDMEKEQLTTVRTKMANMEKAEEFTIRYPSEPQRLRTLLNMPEISTTDEVISKVQKIMKKVHIFENHETRLRDILAHKSKGPDENLIALVEDIMVENDYNKVQCQTKDKLIQQLQNEKQSLLDRAHNPHHQLSADNATNIRKSSSMSRLHKDMLTPRMDFKTLRANTDSRLNHLNLNQMALNNRGKAASPYVKSALQSQSSMGTKFPEITVENHQNSNKETNILNLSAEDEKNADSLPEIDAVQKFNGEATQEAAGTEGVHSLGKVGVFEVSSGRDRRPLSRLGRRRSTIHWEKFLADMTRANHKNDLTKDRYFHRISVGPEGGCFRIPSLDLTITFPKDAFPVEEDEEEEQEVILGVSWNRQDQPRLKPGQVLLSPVFFCLPHDLDPATPLALSFPHPLQLEESPDTRPPRKLTTQILHSKSQVGEVASWGPVETVTNPFRSAGQGELPVWSKTRVVGEMTSERCVLHTTKTGLFTAMAEFKHNQHTTDVKKSMVFMLFSTIHFRDGLLHLYIFMVDDLPSCKMAAHKEMEGSLFLGEHPLSVGYDKETISVTMSDLMEGWRLQSDTTQTIQNRRLWQGPIPSCTYLLKHEVKALQCVLGRLTIYQHTAAPDKETIVAQLPLCIDLDQIPGNAHNDELINSGGSSLFRALDTGGSKKAQTQPRGTPANTPFYNYPSTVESLRRQSSVKWQDKVVHKARPHTKEISLASMRLKAMVGKSANPTVWGPNTLSISHGPEWPQRRSADNRNPTSSSSCLVPHSSQPREGGEPMDPLTEEQPDPKEGGEEEGGEEEVAVFTGEGFSQLMKDSLGHLLNTPNNKGQDWRQLATNLNMTNWIPRLHQANSPTVELLTLFEVTHITMNEVTAVLEELGREDIKSVLLQYNT